MIHNLMARMNNKRKLLSWTIYWMIDWFTAWQIDWFSDRPGLGLKNPARKNPPEKTHLKKPSLYWVFYILSGFLPFVQGFLAFFGLHTFLCFF